MNNIHRNNGTSMDGFKRKEARIYSRARLRIGKHKKFHLQGSKRFRISFEFDGIIEIFKVITKVLVFAPALLIKFLVFIGRKTAKLAKVQNIFSILFGKTKKIFKIIKIFKQIDLPRKAVAVITILILIATIFFQNTPYSQGATYYWVQTDWSGGVTVNDANHTSDQTGWDEYSAADSDITAGTEVTISSTADSVVQTNDGSTNTGFNLAGNDKDSSRITVSGTGSGASVQLSTVDVFGSGADDAVSTSTTFNINTQTNGYGGRTCADGINYNVDTLSSTSADLSTTPAAGCLAADDVVLLINLQGISGTTTNVGNYEFLTVQSVSSNTVDFTTSKTRYYGSGASDDNDIGTTGSDQKVILQRVPQYTNVTIQSGGSLITSAWNGTKGGVLVFYASGTVDVQSGGSISTYNSGYRSISQSGRQGESYDDSGAVSTAANLGGGGGTQYEGFCLWDAYGAGGGGYGTGGSAGNLGGGGGGAGGGTYGDANLNDIFLGSAGGHTSGIGGSGGGIIFINAGTVSVSGTISSSGRGFAGGGWDGGGGAGGSIYLQGSTLGVGSSLVAATGGAGDWGDDGYCWQTSGNGGVGRIYLKSDNITGTTNPSATEGSLVSTYESYGNFTSGIIDTGQNIADWGNLSWNATLNGQALTMKVRSCDDASCSGETAIASCSDISSGTDASTHGCVSNGDRYFQYQAALSGDTTATPSLEDLTINYNYYSPSQTLTSSWYDSNDSTNVLNSIAWSETLLGGTDVKFQLQSAPDSSGSPGTPTGWMGPDGTSGTYFSDETGGDALPAALTSGDNDQWMQYKMFLESTGQNTSIVSDTTLTYVVNAPPEIQNVTSSQGSSGVVTVNYEARDIDTITNQLDITLQYCTANCAGTPTWTDAVSVTGDTGTITGVQTDYSSTYSITWDATAATDYPDQYNGTDFIVRIKADDSEIANNLGYGTSAIFTIDTTAPADGAVPIAVDASATPADVTLSATDDSAFQMRIGLQNDTSDGTWVSYSSSATVSISDDPETVYVMFRDAYGNTSSVSSATTPETPTILLIHDTSNINTTPPEYRLFSSWQTVGAPTPGFAQYNILRSVDDVTYASIGTVTDITENYYTDESVLFDTIYYYKISSEDSDGNVSYRSTSLNGNANGTLDAGEGAIPLTAITSISDPPSVLTDEKAVITFNTDQAAQCTIEYGTSSGSYGEVPVSETSYNINHSMHLTGLIFETIYYHRITCIDRLDNTVSSSEYNFTTLEEQYTETEAAALGDDADETPPNISSISTSDITGESVTISWSTNEDSNSLVKYGLTKEYENMAGDKLVNSDTAEYLTSHSVIVNGLIPATKYYYTVISIDAAGNISESAQKTFTTKAPSNLTSVKVESKALGEALITWQSSKDITSVVEYGLTTEYGEIQESSTKTKDHEITLTGLTSGETYHFRVKGEDEDGNLYASNDYTFIPKSPPQIGNVIIDSISEHSAKVTFTTDIPTDASVTYTNAVNSEDSGIQGKPELTVTHEINFKDLNPGTTYNLVIKVKDEEGNETENLEHSFTTGKDENPPEIEQIKTDTALSQGDKVQALISWETNELADTYLIYKEGVTGEEKEVKVNGDYTLGHISVITTFKAGTVYYFKAKSIDQSGNEAVSSDYALLTPKRRQNIIEIIINNFIEIFSWTRK
ncbi:fibronectin type III domain-containing protein [Patescibacteria group bacterium]